MADYIYLASPIDGGENALVERMKTDVLVALREAGCVVYDPSRAWRVGHGQYEPDSGLWKVNEAAMRECHGMVALLPEGSSSIGVPMEIENYRAQGKPVALIGAKWSWAARAPGVSVHDVLQTEAAIRWLVEQVRARESRPEDNRLPVKFVKDSPESGLPARMYADDVGLDLYVDELAVIEPGNILDISCGVRMQMPEGVWAMIVGRSSTWRKRGLVVLQGIIDPGYRGALFVGVWNQGKERVFIKRGERLAQLLFFNNVTKGLATEWVTELDASERGGHGFGSSGQ